eukprot:COSAG05_NODE_24541_length_251_cov_0.105263_1_plen_55_part_10
MQSEQKLPSPVAGSPDSVATDSTAKVYSEERKEQEAARRNGGTIARQLNSAFTKP